MARKLLLTGCTGYVGHQVARRLADAGWSVLGTSRRPFSLPGIDVTVGSHLDAGFVDESVARCDAVIHLAARTRGHDAAVFRQDNEDVTTLFCRAARRADKPLIYVSSDQAVYGTGFYGRSKRACEEIVSRECDRFAIVRLSAVLGRYAPEMASTFSKIIRQLHRSRFLVVPGDGGHPIAPVWVGDVERVLHGLLEGEQLPNEILELCGDVLSLRELLDLFEGRLGTKRIRIGLPLAPIQLVAKTVKPFRAFARLPLDALLDLGSPIRVSYARLSETLGFTPTPMASAVARIEDFPGSE